MKTMVGYPGYESTIPSVSLQPLWQRILLLCILGYEAAGGLLGGILLMIAPDGRLMNMPVDIMHGTFSDFLIPGIILTGLGILNTIAFITLLRKAPSAWLLAGLAMGGYLIWFWVEIAILLELHWLHAMWGLPVAAGGLLVILLIPTYYITKRQLLLLCGILSSLLYILINIIVPLQWDAYNSATQTVSELSAVNAPTRTLWVILSTPYTLLAIAFAWGVWKSAVENKPLRITGALLIAYSLLGIFWPFAPMHLRETLAAGGATVSDTMHLALGAITEVFYLIALGFAAAALGKKFRIYSIVTFIILLIFGSLTFIDAPGVSKNEPTPFIGIWERINIGVFLLWVIVLGISLWPEDRRLSQ